MPAKLNVSFTWLAIIDALFQGSGVNLQHSLIYFGKGQPGVGENSSNELSTG
ncbi:hypothetical protein PF010_g2585 [Phytophthora fragariae]|uniref:Uncharacterized protein n=1 Tax=Phytophthora fragariae TaxID=53985 RepID=A0A6G0MTH6_9STRA|nr:hypothetical protein PF010_g2585 [Phytophthora fragariae]KAE9179691.1 hypothetical protein PF004_g25071 [Phytophthora fragariae]KAE9355983.1 hypothetical protein PF008_g3824 [Phytophthora fragariae]